MLKVLDSYLKYKGGSSVCFVLLPLVYSLFRRYKSRQALINQKIEDIDKVSDMKKIEEHEHTFRKVTLLYGTTTGTSRALAVQFAERLNQIEGVMAEIYDMSTYNTDMLKEEDLLLLLCSTWSNGRLPENSHYFLEELEELVHDFRVSKDIMGKVQYAVFGLGGEIYGENFCTAAHSVHKALESLGGRSLMPPVCGDDQSDLEQKFDNWCIRVESAVVTSVDSRRVAKKTMDKRKANKGPKSYVSPGTQYVTPESNKTDKGKLKKIKGSVRERKRAAFKAAKARGEIQDHPNRHKKNDSVQSSRDIIEREGEKRREENKIDENDVEEEDLINDTFCRDSDDEDTQSKRSGETMTDMEDLGSY